MGDALATGGALRAQPRRNARSSSDPLGPFLDPVTVVSRSLEVQQPSSLRLSGDADQVKKLGWNPRDETASPAMHRDRCKTTVEASTALARMNTLIDTRDPRQAGFDIRHIPVWRHLRRRRRGSVSPPQPCASWSARGTERTKRQHRAVLPPSPLSRRSSALLPNAASATTPNRATAPQGDMPYSPRMMLMYGKSRQAINSASVIGRMPNSPGCVSTCGFGGEGLEI
jgi:hypothetical protein